MLETERVAVEAERRIEVRHCEGDRAVPVVRCSSPLRGSVLGGVQVTMTVDSMQEQVWTGRLLAGRANELDNLATLIQSRRLTVAMTPRRGCRLSKSGAGQRSSG